MSSVARIIEFIEYKRIKKREFYLKTGFSNGYLDKVKELGSDKLATIISIYPEINLYWLVTGRQEMILKEHSGSADVNLKNKIRQQERIIDNLNDLVEKYRNDYDEIKRELDKLKIPQSPFP